VLWIGTEDRGLCRVELDGNGPEHARISVVRKKDGLFDDGIHRILDDGLGRLWMSTNRGIFRVLHLQLEDFCAGRESHVTSIAYTERDGLRSREANGGVHPAGIRARDGRLWFPTQAGAVVVDPRAVRTSSAAPLVRIEKLQLGAAVLSPAPGSVRLAPDQRSFEIHYTAPSFVHPELTRFRHRLLGFDDKWVQAGTQRSARYTNVPPGSYRLEILAQSHEGLYSAEPATLEVHVAHRFHETRAFQTLVLFGLLLTAAAAWRSRLARLRRRQHELERLVAERTRELELEKHRVEQASATLAAQAAALAELNASRSRFFADFSHELRTPLTLMLGPLQEALRGAYGEMAPTLARQHGMMLRNGRRLQRLINQILDLQRLEAHTLQLDLRPRNLVSLVRDEVRAFQPLAQQRGIALGLTIEQDECILPFDVEQFEKVVANLLSNALKFTHEGGSVDVRLTCGEAGAVLRIVDTGEGIPPEDLPHLFDRFFRGSRSREHEGTGIGLALAREIVELHAGSIEVQSEPGQGSVLTVFLPRREPAPGQVEAEAATHGGAQSGWLVPEPEAAPEDEQPGTDDASLDRTTVLVVDDSADMRAFVRDVLEPGYRIVHANDGREALEQAFELLPDLVVADVAMPLLDGLALSRALKQHPLTDAIPVLLLTARATVEDEVAGLRTGADAYLRKPFDADVLRARVDGLIANRRRLRERMRLELLTRQDTEPASQPAAAEAPLRERDPSPASSDAESLLAVSGPPPGEAPAAPAEQAADSASDSLELRVRRVILEHLYEDNELSVEQLAREVAMSRSQLYRRLKDEAGVSPSDLLRLVRLEEAAKLLRAGESNVSEVAFAVGFNSLAHFSRSFRARFGVSPSELRRAKADAPSAARPAAAQI
jgi:signal transduction histidine kinase/AraC-like DNA-binding protein/CheY-like chemotaxis protein